MPYLQEQWQLLQKPSNIKDIDHPFLKACTARHVVPVCIHGGYIQFGQALLGYIQFGQALLGAFIVCGQCCIGNHFCPAVTSIVMPTTVVHITLWRQLAIGHSCFIVFLLHSYWMPGGRLNPGEGLCEGAKREALEEAGVDVKLTGVLQLEYIPTRSR